MYIGMSLNVVTADIFLPACVNKMASNPFTNMDNL